jgi:lipopolysaccharide transport system permease protein
MNTGSFVAEAQCKDSAVLVEAQLSSRSTPRIIADWAFAPVMCAWRNRELLSSLILRDIQSRFRGTVLGVFWVAAGPLVRLSTYAFIFGILIQPRWQGQVNDPLLIAFTYFSGLILFDFLMECAYSAANLIRDNRVFIKKIVFPVEILPWVAIGHATFRYAVAMALLLLAYTGFKGLPPIETILIPVFFVPFAMIVLGLIWILSSLATFVRDVGHALNTFLPILMFASPVFFPLSALPKTVQTVLMFNPLTFPLEQTRAVLFGDGFHAWIGLAVYGAVALLISATGYRFFMRLRPGFADVL